MNMHSMIIGCLMIRISDDLQGRTCGTYPEISDKFWRKKKNQF